MACYFTKYCWKLSLNSCNSPENNGIEKSSSKACFRSRFVESYSMGLLPDTQNCGLRMRRECRERFVHRRLQRKPQASDPGMHHGTCVTHVSWCMSGSLMRNGGETFPAFPAHAQPAILRIWQEAHSVDIITPIWRGWYALIRQVSSCPINKYETYVCCLFLFDR